MTQTREENSPKAQSPQGN